MTEGGAVAPCVHDALAQVRTACADVARLAGDLRDGHAAAVDGLVLACRALAAMPLFACSPAAHATAEPVLAEAAGVVSRAGQTAAAVLAVPGRAGEEVARVVAAHTVFVACLWPRRFSAPPCAWPTEDTFVAATNALLSVVRTFTAPRSGETSPTQLHTTPRNSLEGNQEEPPARKKTRRASPVGAAAAIASPELFAALSRALVQLAAAVEACRVHQGLPAGTVRKVALELVYHWDCPHTQSLRCTKLADEAVRCLEALFVCSDTDERQTLLDEYLFGLSSMAPYPPATRVPVLVLARGARLRRWSAVPLLLLQCLRADGPDSPARAVYTEALAVGRHMLATLFSLANSSSAAAPIRTFFGDFVDDLLAVFTRPEWPAAESLLHLTIVALTRSQSTLRTASVELLGRIGARLAAECSFLRTRQTREGLCPLCSSPHTSNDGQCACWRAGAALWNKHMTATGTTCKHLFCHETPATPGQLPPVGALREVLLLHYHLDEQARPLYQFVLSKWLVFDEQNTLLSSGEKEALNKCLSEQWTTPLVETTEEDDVRAPSAEVAEAACQAVTREMPAMAAAETVLWSVLRLLIDPQPSFRARAVKALADVLDADTTLFEQEQVRLAVSARLMDTAVSVRSCAVELVGRHLLRCADAAPFGAYYRALAVHVLDAGTSVRKQVVRILHSVCCSAADLPLSASERRAVVLDACTKLAGRLGDEESVRAAALRAFADMWFSSEAAADEHAEQLVAVVAACQKECAEELIVGLLRDAMAANQEVCACLCDAVVSLFAASPTGSPRLASCVFVLDLFCQAAPALLVPYVTVLAPNLRPAPGRALTDADCAAVNHLAAIVRRVAPLWTSPSDAETVRLVESLILLLRTEDPRQLRIARECTAALAAVCDAHATTYAVLSDLFDHFCGVLGSGSASRVALWSAFYSLGVLCQASGNLSPARNGSMLFSVVRARTVFLAALQRHRSDSDLMCSAHRGLCALCARWVALLQDGEITGLFSAALSSPGSVATAVVSELLTLLRTPRDEPCCDSALTAAGAVVQQNIRVLLARAVEPEATLRTTTVQLLDAVARHGIVNPALVVPAAVAALADPGQPAARDLAARLLAHLRQKYPGALTPSKLADGVHQGNQLQRALWHKASPVVWGARTPTVRALFAPLYPPATAPRATRFAVIAALLAPFRFLDDAEPTAAAATADADSAMEHLVFASEVVAFLPFVLAEDVAETVRAVDALVLVRGGGALETAKQDLRRSASAALTPASRAHVFALALLLTLKAFLLRTYGPVAPADGEGAPARVPTPIDAVAFDKKQSPFADVCTARTTSDTVLYHALKTLLDSDRTPATLPTAATARPRKRGRPRKTPPPASAAADDAPAPLERRSSSALTPAFLVDHGDSNQSC